MIRIVAFRKAALAGVAGAAAWEAVLRSALLAGVPAFDIVRSIGTLVVDEAVGGGVTEMITFFNIHGAMVYVDAAGATTGYEDVFTKIAMCRRHYAACGLGEGFVDQFVR